VQLCPSKILGKHKEKMVIQKIEELKSSGKKLSDVGFECKEFIEFFELVLGQVVIKSE